MSAAPLNAPRRPPAILHPLAGATLPQFIRRYVANAPYDRRSLGPRLLAGVAAVVRAPWDVYEHCRFRRLLADHGVPRDPVFIIGHWRSGTTHLHYLLSQDPRFAWPSVGQMSLPWNMLGGFTTFARRYIQRVLPARRSFDQVKLSVDSPQEEEIALGNLNPLSYFNGYYYPRDFERNFQRAVLLQDLTPREVQAFSDAYRLFATKLSFAHGGKQLLFKNPSSTARIGLLKQLFPEARFIHIVRNPFHVFASSLRRLKPMFDAFAWQDNSHLDLETIVIDCYRGLMQSYLAQVESIPQADILETSYEAVVEDPIAEIHRIYDAFQLPDKDAALARIEPYLETLRDYSPNVHTLTSQQVERIQREWQFALNRWSYKLPPDLAPRDTAASGSVRDIGVLSSRKSA